MARQIDERIVQMTFNNENFERKANQTISTLSSLNKAADFTGLNKGFSELGRNANSLNFNPLMDTLKAVSNQFSLWEQIGIGALRRIGDQAVQTGERLIKSLTIDLVSTGWGKYNDLNASVQTLVNSTGKSVDEIDGYLKRLMWYSDETSFGFTDMTKALGTMVSSGGDIDKLIPMLMGMGNAVAYAGKGAAEFTRVVYNLNQSYSSGALLTQDWRSIELAGADSKQLKEQLLGVAVALGKVDKSKATIDNFRQLLSDRVFTRDVMEQAFGNFAEMTLEAERLVNEGKFQTASEAIESLSGKYSEFAERAFKSAQEAKSFKEAIEATQDAVSSGWMQTFQIIFGSYDEAKQLWTDVVEDLWDIFASGAQRRNDILAEWKNIWDEMTDPGNVKNMGNVAMFQEMSQYASQTHAVIAAISDLILQIRDDISSVFAVVFPIKKVINEAGQEVEDYTEIAHSIFSAVEQVRRAIISLREDGLESDVARAFRKGLQALLEVLKTVGAYARTFVDSFIKPLHDMLMPVIQEVGAVFALIFGEIIRGAQDARKDLSPFQSVLQGILNVLKPIIDFIGQIVRTVKQWLAEASVAKVLDEDSEKITIFSKLLNSVAKVLNFVANVFNGTINVFQSLATVFGGIIDKIRDSLGELLSSHGTDIAGLAEGGLLGILAYGLTTVISKFKKMDFKSLIEGLVEGFTDSKNGFIGKIKGVLDSVSETLNAFSQSIKIKMLQEIANAVVKLAAALLIISLVDSEKIAGSLFAMMTVLGEAIAAIGVLGAMKVDGINSAVKVLSKIATSIVILAVALKILSGIKPEQIGPSLLLLGSTLGIVFGFIGGLNVATKYMTDEKVTAVGKAIKSIGFSLIEMAIALKIIASIKPDQMKTALIGLGGTLLGVAGFIIAISKLTNGKGLDAIQDIGKAMVTMGLGLIELSLALKIIGTMNIAEIGVALLGLIAGLGAIFGFAVGVSNLTKGGAGSFAMLSVSMIAMGTGILILAAAMKVLGSMSLAQIGKGLAGIAGALLILGGAAVVLGTLSVPLLLASAAIAAFGGALLIAAKGITAFVAVSALINTIGSDISGSLLNILMQASAAIIQLIPGLFLGIGQAIINIGGQLVTMVGQIIGLIIQAITENVPRIIETGIFLLTSLLTAIAENVSNFVILGGTIITNLLNGISEALPDVIIAAVNLIGTFAESLGTAVPLLIESGWQMIVNFLNGLAEAIRSNAGDIGAAFGNLCSAIIEGIVTGFGSAVASFGSNILSFGSGIIDGIRGLFGGEQATTEANNTGNNLVTSVSEGVEENRQALYDTAQETGEETAKKMDATDEATTSGKNTLGGLVTGLADPALLEQISQRGREAGRAFMDAYNLELDINSPSRVMEKSGEYTIAGLLRAFSDLRPIQNAGYSVGEAIADSISEASYIAEQLVSEDLSPIITPVLDLSAIQNGAGSISSMLDTGASYRAALAVNGMQTMNGRNQNGVINNPVINVDFTVNEAGGRLSNDEISKFGKQIADEANIRLGKMLWR